jgi:HAD superfamily hydrolase (TIGR01484 family)
MQPFATLSDTALRSIEAVACDLDDTLTHDGSLTASALTALHALARAGVPCFVVTGRPLGWADVLTRLFPVRGVVTENGGAWILREGSERTVTFLQDETVRAEGMAHVLRFVDHLTQTCPILARVHDLTERATDVALDIHESANVPDAIVLEAIRMAREAGVHAIASTVHLHLSSRQPDKVAGMLGAARGAGLDPERVASHWIYVGDSPNDASAFAAIQHSVGVANVRAFEGKMPSWPRYVTEGVAGDGFAEVVERLLRARGRG